MLNIWKIQSDAVATFYSPQTRFWELLTGSILAYIALYKNNFLFEIKHKYGARLISVDNAHSNEAVGKIFRNILSLLGAILIGAGIIFTSKERAFPGWWALFPTLGAILIISAGGQAWLNRVVLSSRWLVWFGLISYPLYLWHWPLLSFARIVEGENPFRFIRVAAVLISIVLAWLTYSFVEKPFRFGIRSKAKVISLLVLMVIVAFVGFATYKLDGLKFRSAAAPDVKNDGDIGNERFYEYIKQKFHLCTSIEPQQDVLIANGTIKCFQSGDSASKQIAIIGDSHAEPLFIGLSEALPRANIFTYVRGQIPTTNSPSFSEIFKYVIADKNISVVFLTAYWNSTQGGMTVDVARKGDLAKTVSALIAANKRVYILDDVPFFPFDAKICKYKSKNYEYRRQIDFENKCAEERDFFFARYIGYYPILQYAVEENPSAKMLITTKYFCSSGFCSMEKDGHLLYRDNNHLNINGSKLLGQLIVNDNSEFDSFK